MDAVDHRLDSEATHILARLLITGQRDAEQSRIFDIVKTTDFYLLRYLRAEVNESAEESGCRGIVGAYGTIYVRS